MDDYIDVGPERILAVDRSTVQFITTSAHRILSTPEYEVTCLVDSPVPADHEWSPPWEAVSTIVHSLPVKVTRMTVRFERV
jgi:hypothetical protein